ncbi:hypothetical protein PC110_g19671 [Phytophthora cactorum]|uniref:Uncharacterized protein n=1 Tax=Phytophthora cactorum TaxID=29920 RepID=A0A329RKP4_9STRA|nr:hypothetical protein PC110_g19671 [Phytophthora cactorum]
MMNIGQPWATAPSPYLVPVEGMPGQLLVIPGIGGTGLQTELTSNRLSGAMMTDGEEAVAGFTNPRGVWNKYSGTWDVTPGRVWNGQFWYEPKKNLKNVLPRTRLGQADGREEAGQGTENKGSISYLQYRRVGCKTAEEEDEDSCAADESTDQINGRVVDSSTAANAAWVPRLSTFGHFAKDCTDADVKARNEEVLKERREGVTAQENGKPAQ